MIKEKRYFIKKMIGFIEVCKNRKKYTTKELEEYSLELQEYTKDERFEENFKDSTKTIFHINEDMFVSINLSVMNAFYAALNERPGFCRNHNYGEKTWGELCEGKISEFNKLIYSPP